MKDSLHGRAALIDALLERADSWKKGSSSIVFVTGEPGMGKSAVLKTLSTKISEKFPASVVIRVDCHPGLGMARSNSIQPLQPFGLAIEQLFRAGESVARKRLAVNIGMSLLASIPLAGDVFYAVKAISQDVSEYKRETAGMTSRKRSAVEDCINTLSEAAAQSPFILLVDDFQWADKQSVEVVRQLATMDRPPFLLVATINTAEARRLQSDVLTLLSARSSNLSSLALTPVTIDDVSRMLEAAVGKAFDISVSTRLLERSAGNPGIVREYLDYMVKSLHTDPSADVDDLLLGATALGDHPSTSVALNAVPENDALVLANCAAEGREFTAYLAAALMNVDVLTAVRTLRRIHRTTGLIQSLGARTRYSLRTTVYEFTSDFTYTFFLHLPEYEERKDLHARIARILSAEAMKAMPLQRRQILLDAAAHASQAEDNEQSRLLLDEEIEHSFIRGDDQGAGFLHDDVRPLLIHMSEHDSAERGSDAISVSTDTVGDVSFSVSLRSCADAFIAGEFASARQLAATLLEQVSRLLPAEHVMATCLLARSMAELGNVSEALDKLHGVISIAPDDLHKAYISNAMAAIHFLSGNKSMARELLIPLTSNLNHLPAYIVSLTMGNTLLMMRAEKDSNAQELAARLKKTLPAGMYNFRSDLGI